MKILHLYVPLARCRGYGFFCTYILTSPQRGLALKYHLRSNSGSNGPIAKECHRFLVAGPFKLLAESNLSIKIRPVPLIGHPAGGNIPLLAPSQFAVPPPCHS